MSLHISRMALTRHQRYRFVRILLIKVLESRSNMVDHRANLVQVSQNMFQALSYHIFHMLILSSFFWHKCLYHITSRHLLAH
uniref:Uncharacterized protein n=1 Tax=Oryza nivara TaxID=4536 RepID=A0A0E0FXY2_ORYNI